MSRTYHTHHEPDTYIPWLMYHTCHTCHACHTLGCWGFSELIAHIIRSACFAIAGLSFAQVDPYTLPAFQLTDAISGNAGTTVDSGAYMPLEDIATESEILVIDENDEVVRVIPSQLVRLF